MKAFIFDMDGVIIDSEPQHIEVEIATVKKYGSTITEEDLAKYMGMVSPEMWASVKKEHNLQATLEDILEHQITEKLLKLKKSDLEPIEGIKELMKELSSRGIPMAVASSSPRVYIHAVLEKFGITDEFASILSGEEVNQGKPAPDIYLETAQLLGVRPEECVVLEDSRNGVRAAKAAGMTCIGYVAPDAGSQNLSEADRIVSSILDIQLDKL